MSNLKDRHRNYIKKKITLEDFLLKEEKNAESSVPFISLKELLKDKPKGCLH